MIEAVFEDPAVKAQVFAEIEPFLAEGALLGSNTSTLPITGLAEGVSRPADFIGLHFFSPVDKMPLLEIIKGEETSEETTYRALDVAKQIKKTPIVVNDSRGFFTSRVIGTFINEGIAMLAEGVPAADDRAGDLAGRLPGPGAPAHGRAEHGAGGQDPQGHQGGRSRPRATEWTEHPSFAVVDKMLEEGRPGKLRGAGFYDYEDGKRAGLWTGLKELFPPSDDPASIDLQRPRGAHALRRGARDGQVPRRGRARDRVRRQHRLDHGHRVPGLDRRSDPVHQRLRGRPGRVRRACPRARGASTASGSSRRRRWWPRPRPARSTPTRRWSPRGSEAMPLTLTDEQQDFVAAVRDFAQRECGTREQRDALTDNFTEPHNEELYAKVAELGWLGVAIPEEYGGTGRRRGRHVPVPRGDVLRADPDRGLRRHLRSPPAPTSASAPTSRRRRSSAASSSGNVEAIAMSEPEAGSDVGALRCKAVRENGGYVINGQKTWISEAHFAEHILLVCRTDDSGKKHDGLTMLVIPKDADGMEIRGIDTMGGRVVNDVFFTDCEVPAENLVGVEGQAWMQLMAGLNVERLIIAAQSLGYARRALDDTLDLRQGAQAVRQADRQLPGALAPDRRPRDRGRVLQAARLRRRRRWSTPTPARCSRARPRWPSSR